LVHAYGKCKSDEGASRVFDDLVVRDVVTWSSLSSCYVSCEFPWAALAVFHEMRWNGVKPDPMTVSSILPACSDLKDLQSGNASSYWFDPFFIACFILLKLMVISSLKWSILSISIGL